MKAKIIILISLLSFGLCLNVFAQKGSVEGRFDIGYGFPSGVQPWANGANGATLANTTPTTQTVGYYSLGAGLNIALQGTYWFSDYVGGGIDFNYLIGTPASITQNNGIYSQIYTETASMFSITPIVVFMAHGDKLSPYGRFGLVIGLPSFIGVDTYSGTNPPHVGTQIYDYNGNSSIGWYAALGCEFPITDKLSLFAELFNRTLSYSPNEAVNTQAFNNEPIAPNTIYADSRDPNSTSTSLRVYSPFSSVGINIGVAMTIGGK